MDERIDDLRHWWGRTRRRRLKPGVRTVVERVRPTGSSPTSEPASVPPPPIPAAPPIFSGTDVPMTPDAGMLSGVPAEPPLSVDADQDALAVEAAADEVAAAPSEDEAPDDLDAAIAVEAPVEASDGAGTGPAEDARRPLVAAAWESTREPAPWSDAQGPDVDTLRSDGALPPVEDQRAEDAPGDAAVDAPGDVPLDPWAAAPTWPAEVPSSEPADEPVAAEPGGEPATADAGDGSSADPDAPSVDRTSPPDDAPGPPSSTAPPTVPEVRWAAPGRAPWETPATGPDATSSMAAAGPAAAGEPMMDGLHDDQQRWLGRDVKLVEGIGSGYGAQLEAAGIRTLEDLLLRGATRRSRQAIADSTGISGKLILRWVNNADLFRIRGVGTQYADLLEAAGVDTVVELALRRPDSLAARLATTNELRSLVRQVPSEGQVADWVRQARELPRIVAY